MHTRRDAYESEVNKLTVCDYQRYNGPASLKEFKEIFIEEYQSGKTPVRIFREHGFDVAVLGANRIGHAGCRIRKQYEERGTFTGGHGDRGHRNTANSIASTVSSEDELKQLRHEVNYLRQEVDFLKKISSIRITRKSQQS